MKKKIKITENQFNLIKENLFGEEGIKAMSKDYMIIGDDYMIPDWLEEFIKKKKITVYTITQANSLRHKNSTINHILKQEGLLKESEDNFRLAFEKVPFARYKEDPWDQFQLTLFYKDKQVGNTNIVRNPKAESGEWSINGFFIEKEYQGHGLSYKLMQKLFDFSKQHGVKTLELGVSPDNYSARKVYDKMGFTPYDKTSDYILMRKEL